MILVVEGLDNTGKSTLIKNIRKHVLTRPRTAALHCSSTPLNVDEQWPFQHYNNLLSAVQQMSFNDWDVILDRSHLGEAVYGPLYRSVHNTDYIFDLERKYLYMHDVALILLTDDAESLVEREDGDSQSVAIDDIESLSKSFLEAYHASSITNKLHYHISSDGGFDDLLPTVKEFITNVKDS